MVLLTAAICACGQQDAPPGILVAGDVEDMSNDQFRYHGADGADGGGVARAIPFETYLAWAEERCREKTTDSRSKLLVGLKVLPAHVRTSNFFFELGFGYIYVNEACEMWLPPHEDEFTPYLHWAPPRYKQLNPQELASLMYRLRALEWGRLEEGNHYGLTTVEGRTLLRLSNDTYSVSSLYSEISNAPFPVKEWNDTDYFIESVLGFKPYEDPELLDSTEPFVGEAARFHVIEADPRLKWEQNEEFIHSWPLSFPPSDLTIEKAPTVYCRGTSTLVVGENAASLRRSRDRMLNYGSLYPNRTNHLPTSFEGRKLWLQIREVLPLEESSGGVVFLEELEGDFCGQ